MIGKKDSAMGLYPIAGNESKLASCEVKEIVENEQLNCKVIIFNDAYRKRNIDLVLFNGDLFISDYYGESMKREDVFYILFRGGRTA